MTPSADTVERERPLKIEMLLPSMATAGMEVLVARMARGLIHRGHRVGITCLETLGDLGPTLLDEGIRVDVVPTPGLRTLLHAPALARALTTATPDVVHVHNGAWVKGVGAARRVGLPVVATVHGFTTYESLHDRVLQHWASRRTDRVVAVSQAVLDTLRTRVRVAPPRCQVILNGVDTKHFSPSRAPGTLRRRIGVDDTAPLIGHVARMDHVKNPLLLIDAFAIVRRSVPGVRLVMIGDGPMRPLLEQRILDLNLGDAVHLLGIITDVAPYYRDLDAFALSSHTEGTSVSMLEAMSSGIACVATKVGGNTQLLAHGRCGLLTEPGSVESMSAALTRLLTDAGQRELFGRAGLDRVRTTYSEQTMLDEYEALYRRLARGSAQAAAGDTASTDREVVCAE